MILEQTDIDNIYLGFMEEEKPDSELKEFLINIIETCIYVINELDLYPLPVKNKHQKLMYEFDKLYRDDILNYINENISTINIVDIICKVCDVKNINSKVESVFEKHNFQRFTRTYEQKKLSIQKRFNNQISM